VGFAKTTQFVLGWRNWLFAGAPSGADAGATFFSLIETAKANRLEPYSYLRCLFEKLPLVKDQKEYRALLPQTIDPESINLIPAFPQMYFIEGLLFRPQKSALSR